MDKTMSFRERRTREYCNKNNIQILEHGPVWRLFGTGVDLEEITLDAVTPNDPKPFNQDERPECLKPATCVDSH